MEKTRFFFNILIGIERTGKVEMVIQNFLENKIQIVVALVRSSDSFLVDFPLFVMAPCAIANKTGFFLVPSLDSSPARKSE